MINKLLFSAFIFLSINTTAQTFNYSGINYKVIDYFDFKVEVGINKGFVGDLHIPATVSYNNQVYQVTDIGQDAFSNCSGLTSAIIPNTITKIKWSAFAYCSNLTSVTIPNSVDFIYPSTFLACTGLTSITIPESVNNIGGAAFSRCSNLTSVTIPDSVITIGDNAFSYCSSLISINIPNSVTQIHGYAFKNCSGLTSFTIPNSVNFIGVGAFSNCSNLTSINIPYGVDRIDDGVFANCISLNSVTIPNSVNFIEYYAFSNCSSLTSITIPDSVDIIREGAFNNCTSLTTVNCNILIPQIIDASVFGGVNQSNCALNVNKVSLAAYLNTPVWQNFNPINGVLSNNKVVKTNFSIYPNPSDGIINISLDNNLQLEKLTIYNQSGQVVKTSTYKTISAAELAKGIYIVEVVTNEGKATKKLKIK